MTAELKPKKPLPLKILIPALLLLADGVLALLGGFFYRTYDPSRVYDMAGALVIVGTSISVLLDHRSATVFSCACALLLTLDQIRSVLPVSAPGRWPNVGPHLIINVVLYWVAFVLYISWRRKRFESS